MNISILGAGNIGGAVGKKWAEMGYTITFGVRDANSSKTQAALAGIDARAVPISEAIATGEVILFSIPWAVVTEVAQANAAVLDGKILIDATNNFGGPIINNMTALKNAAPNAHYFRVFNSLGWEHFVDPLRTGMQTDHFYTGPDGEHRTYVENLIEEIGLRPIWVGDNDRIQIVDNIGALWVTLAFQRGFGRGIAFKMVGK